MMKRRKFLLNSGLAVVGASLSTDKSQVISSRSTRVRSNRTLPDVVVVGSGVFGVWTAWHLF